MLAGAPRAAALAAAGVVLMAAGTIMLGGCVNVSWGRMVRCVCDDCVEPPPRARGISPHATMDRGGW